MIKQFFLRLFLVCVGQIAITPVVLFVGYFGNARGATINFYFFFTYCSIVWTLWPMLSATKKTASIAAALWICIAVAPFLFYPDGHRSGHFQTWLMATFATALALIAKTPVWFSSLIAGDKKADVSDLASQIHDEPAELTSEKEVAAVERSTPQITQQKL
jgi:hypothetical protein